jgi:tRNA pseudouridine55 synthase
MNGVIIIDKPAGPTSAEVVRLVKARLGRKTRVGHLGTLDPFATGVLPILVGEGTKLAPFLQETEKEYAGIIAIGTETDTLDPTGAMVRTAAVPILDAERLGAIAARFTGMIEQTPPVFSAIKRAGVPLYKLARRGDTVEPPAPRTVEIKRLELTVEGTDRLRFTVACSPGMYVRSLARDIGVALGSAAHLAELRRVRNGDFSIAQAVPLAAALEQLERGDHRSLIGMRAALRTIPELEVDAAIERRLRHGDSRALDDLAPRDTKFFKVIARGDLVAIAESTSRITATIARIFNADLRDDQA